MKWVTYITVTLIVLLITLVVGSWIVSAVMPEMGINSMLSGEGIRWYVGHLTDILATQYLVWIILLAMSIGVTRESCIVKVIATVAHRQHIEYHERLGLHAAAIGACILTAVIIYLIAAPNAVLLGATGRLIPSAFAMGLVPIISFFLTLISGIYGFTAGVFTSLTSFITAMCHGISAMTPIIIIYVISAQLIACGLYIF